MGIVEHQCRIRAVWLRRAESTAWIAERSGVYLDGLSRQLGVDGWDSLYLKRRWPADVNEREQMVLEGVYREEDQTPYPSLGYTLTLNGVSPQAYAEVEVHAGHVGLGRNLPAHVLRLRLSWRLPESPTGAQLDDLVALTVNVWEPVMVSFTTHELGGSDWRIEPGWRLWLRNDVGTFETLHEGVTAVELDGGTLLKAPEEWSPEQVKAAVGGTLEANGLAVLPFDEAAQ